jgi:hypothetical protein
MIGVFAAQKRMPRHCKRSLYSCLEQAEGLRWPSPFVVRGSLCDYLGKSCAKTAHDEWYEAKIEVRNFGSVKRSEGDVLCELQKG